MTQTFQGNISKDIITGIIISSLIFILSIYMPLIGFFFSLLVPLPIFFYRSKLGRVKGAIVLLVTIFLIILILGSISIETLFFVELMLLGFVLSELIEFNLSIEKIILYACGIVLATGFICLLLYSKSLHTDIESMVSEYVSEYLKLVMELYQNMGMQEENIQIISDSLASIRYVIVRILPAFAVVSSFFIAWSCLLLAKPVFKVKNIYYPDFGLLNLWKAPEFLVWYVIGCGFMLFLPSSGFKLFGLNGLIVLMSVYFFQGIAIVSFFFERKQFPFALRFILYSLIAFQQILLIFIIMLGFFDIWLNLRKIKPPKTGSHQSS